jgi:uncharacterized repeat protein (TIGR01451 family)
VAALALAGLPISSLEAYPRTKQPRDATAKDRSVPRIATAVLAQKAILSGLPDGRGNASDGFGRSVAIDGDTAVIGVPGRNWYSERTGVVYVFERGGGEWMLQAVLDPPASNEPVAFGSSVAVSGDTIIIGAASSIVTEGGAYVFARSGTAAWQLQAALRGSDTRSSDSFGVSVAIDGDTAVVGAVGASAGAAYAGGAAYVFARTGASWSQQQKLTLSDPEAYDGFGRAVAVAGDTVLIGAPGRDSAACASCGSAHLFVRSAGAWVQAQQLLPTLPQESALFGTAVSISGDKAVVGAPGQDFLSYWDAGTAFVFARTGSSWGQTAILRSPSPATYDNFAAFLSLSETTTAIGSPGAWGPRVYIFRSAAGPWLLEQAIDPPVDWGPYDGGAVAVSGDALLFGFPSFDLCGVAFAYVRTAGTWSLAQRFDDPGTTAGDNFGQSMSASGTSLAVGSPSDTTNVARRSGSVTVYGWDGASWTFQQKLIPSDPAGSFGDVVSLSGDLLAVSQLTSFEGRVCIYRRAGAVWSLEQRLDSPFPGYEDFLAHGLAIGGNTLLVTTFGAAYVYENDAGTWVLRQTLAPTGGTSFGPVTLAGDTAVLGNPGPQRRLAAVYRRVGGTWVESQALEGSDDRARWVQALQIEGSELVVGASERSFTSEQRGAVYAFVESGGAFSPVQKILAPEPAQYPWFGAAADFMNDRLVVGAPQGHNSGSGAAYVFARRGAIWVVEQKLVVSDAGEGRTVGTTVAVAQDHVLLGYPGADANGALGSGAVYVFGPATSDLVLGMTAFPGAVAQGDFVTFDLTLTNNGPYAVSGPSIEFDPRPGMALETAQASSGNCVRTNGTVSCTYGIVSPGATVTARVVAVAMDWGSVTTVATSQPGGQSAQVVTSVASRTADVSVVKFAGSAPVVGLETSYTVEVYNSGPDTAAGVLLADPTPAGVELLDIQYDCLEGFPCLIPRLPAGSKVRVWARYRVPEDYPSRDPIVNVASVTTTTSDPDLSNNTARVEAPFAFPASNLGFYTMTPCRLLDTRERSLGGSIPLAPGHHDFRIERPGCRPDLDARALAVTVTVTGPTADGHLKLFGGGLPTPGSSFLNYRAGQTRSNNGVISIARYTTFTVEVAQDSGWVHVIVDVVGYYR